MWSNYDENLTQNPFLKELLGNHDDLVRRASQDAWIICVPRCGVLNNDDISPELFLDHILIPNNDNERINFTTLSKRPIIVKDRQISRPQDSLNPIQVLFEETFYIEKLKYVVWCIDRPLFRLHIICDSHQPKYLETLYDCIDFLWSEGLGNALDQIRGLCRDFVRDNVDFQIEYLQTQRDLIGNLYSQCLQICLKSVGIERLSENLKLAVETFMQSCLDKNLVRGINTFTCHSDSYFNKILRHSSEFQLKDFNISNKFAEAITKAKSELNKINNYVTILDKVFCLKATFEQIYGSNLCVTSDEILQILSFIITKLNVNNWISNLVYLTQFKFSSLNYSDESNFLITSLEAALEFLKSNQFRELRIDIGETVQNHYMFELVRLGDLDKIKETLDNSLDLAQKQPELCHPLCICESCCRIRTLPEDNHSLSSVNENGQTLLIYSAFIGNVVVTEYLLSQRIDINSQDYFGRTAMHYASSRGHQDLVLILINADADVNLLDTEGNSSLHLAVNYGHENCVKALIYSSKTLQLNTVNNSGETALYLAVKWGFLDLIRLLLENGAKVIVNEAKSRSPLTLTQNYYIEQLLNQFLDSHELGSVNVMVNQVLINRKKTDKCQEHGVRPRNFDQFKKIDLLLKAIENNDLPLTCFYLGFSSPSATSQNPPDTLCHPLCNCDKCEDLTDSPSSLEKINVNLCNVEGFTALHFAAKYGRNEVLRLLLDSRASPNLKTYKTLYTPLHLACVYQRLHIVKELVKCADCEVDARDFKGNTPLFYACNNNDLRIIEILLDSGADGRAQNQRGETAIKWAHEKGFFGILKLLEDWKLADNNGDTDEFL